MTTPRRALPPGGDDDRIRRPDDGARRAAEGTSDAPHAGAAPRRSAAPGGRSGPSEHRAAWQLLGGLGIALALLLGVLYATVGARPMTADPAPSTSSPSPTSQASDVPGSSADPSTVESSGSDAAAPSAAAGPEEIDLLDTVLVVPDGWEVYADELVQDSRRLVRLREPVTDVRVQAVSLTSVGDDLQQACTDLVTDQSTAFSDVSTSLVVDVAVRDGATGASCSFTGTRTSDEVQATTEFTLLRRDSDGHTLIFRDTVPAAVADDSPVLDQLAAMECAAADAFGAAVDAC